MGERKRECFNCDFCGMDMDMDPYCAHPKVLEKFPFGKALYNPNEFCPSPELPLFKPRTERTL